MRFIPLFDNSCMKKEMPTLNTLALHLTYEKVSSGAGQSFDMSQNLWKILNVTEISPLIKIVDSSFEFRRASNFT